MPRDLIRPQKGLPTPSKPDGSIDPRNLDRALASAHSRLSELEARENDRLTDTSLSGSIASSIDATDLEVAALSASIASIHGRYLGQQSFPGSGTLSAVDATYTPTSGTYTVLVRMVGGGGGGGGAQSVSGEIGCGGGGGSGAYIEFVLSGTLITGGAVSSGNGGARGTQFANGSNGASTTAVINGSLYGAAGGGGGETGVGVNKITGQGGAWASGKPLGGSSAVGTISGQAGTFSVMSVAAGFWYGGAGGSCPLGIGGENMASPASGSDGRGYGSGGSGGASEDSSQNGGNGAPGIVIIDEWS